MVESIDPEPGKLNIEPWHLRGKLGPLRLRAELEKLDLPQLALLDLQLKALH